MRKVVRQEQIAVLNTLCTRIVPTVASCVENGIEMNDKALQLTSVFLTLDTDGDHQLNHSQLITALQLVGLAPRENLLSKFYVKKREKEDNEVIQPALMTGDGLSSTLQRRPNAKVGLNTFLAVTLEALNLQEGKNDFNLLFELMGSKESIPLKDLKHLLVDTMSPVHLTKAEFDIYLYTLGVGSRQRETLEGEISCDLLMEKMKM